MTKTETELGRLGERGGPVGPRGSPCAPHHNSCTAGRSDYGPRLEAVRGALQRMKGAAQIAMDDTGTQTDTQTDRQT